MSSLDLQPLNIPQPSAYTRELWNFLRQILSRDAQIDSDLNNLSRKMASLEEADSQQGSLRTTIEQLTAKAKETEAVLINTQTSLASAEEQLSLQYQLLCSTNSEKGTLEAVLYNTATRLSNLVNIVESKCISGAGNTRNWYSPEDATLNTNMKAYNLDRLENELCKRLSVEVQPKPKSPRWLAPKVSPSS